MKSVRTALRVFEEVAACQPVGLSELSRRLQVPKASVQRALTTLAEAGWLRHDLNHPGTWVVTARFSVLADASPEVIAARDAARPFLRDLRSRSGGWVGFFVLDGDRMVLLAGPEETTLRALEAERGPLPVHVSAAGRAILAALPDDTVEEVLGRAPGLEDDPALMARVARSVAHARADGYAVVDGEYRDDLVVIAAAVLDDEAHPVAALAVMLDGAQLPEGGAPAVGSQVEAAARAVRVAIATGGPVG